MEGFTLYAACILEIGLISLEAGFELLDISTGWTVYFVMHFFGVRILTTHLKIFVMARCLLYITYRSFSTIYYAMEAYYTGPARGHIRNCFNSPKLFFDLTSSFSSKLFDLNPSMFPYCKALTVFEEASLHLLFMLWIIKTNNLFPSSRRPLWLLKCLARHFSQHPRLIVVPLTYPTFLPFRLTCYLQAHFRDAFIALIGSRDQSYHK